MTIVDVGRQIANLQTENDRLRDVIARASRLCEQRDIGMVLQVLREAVPSNQEEVRDA